MAYEIHDLGFGVTPRQIVLTTLLEGGNHDTELVALTGGPEASWPQVHARSGRLWLDWIDLDGEMAWSRRLPAGGWGAVTLEVYVGLEDLRYHVRGRIKAQVLD